MRSNRRTRIKVIGLVLVLIMIAVVYFTIIRKGAAPDYIETTGVMEATEVELAPKISGRIEWLCCAEGDSIKAGTTAVRLDSRELKAKVEEARASILESEKTIAESEVNLENSKVLEEAARFDVKASEAEVERTKALVNDAKDNLDRAKGLFKDGFLSKKDLDSAQTAYDANNAQFETSLARRSGSYAGLKNAATNTRAALARISTAKARKARAVAQLKVALAQFNDTDIISPIDGVVVYKSYELGEYVNPGASIYTVDDLKNVWARVDIEETSVDRVKLGARALIFTPGQPEKAFEGRIIEVGVVGGFATQRDVTRGRPDIKTFRVKAGIIKPDGALKPGMTVMVRILIGK